MANSYGCDGVPEDALYGDYDCFNGEWTGVFYFTREDALDAANDEFYKGEQFGISSTTDFFDWLN